MGKKSNQMTIYEKIQAVSQEVGAISKDMNVGGQYKAVSDLAVTLAINKAEVKYRLLSIPLKQELINSEIHKNIDTVVYEVTNTNTNIKQTNTTNTVKTTYTETIKMTVRIIDLDQDNVFVDVETYGRGLDSGDKGFGKASTYARKYGLLNAYKIPTGEDPDRYPSPTEKNVQETQAPIPQKQVQNNNPLEEKVLSLKEKIEKASSEELTIIFNENKDLQQLLSFKTLLNNRHSQLKTK